MDMIQQHILVSDPDAEKLASLAAHFRIKSSADNNQAVANADIVILAVKPQAMENVARTLADTLQQTKPLVISIAAGIP